MNACSDHGINLVCGPPPFSSRDHKQWARSVLLFYDSLIIGPSSIRSTQHGIGRRRFWDAVEESTTGKSLHELPSYAIYDVEGLRAGLSRHDYGKPLFVWMHRDPNDVLFLWWICYAIHKERRFPKNLLLVWIKQYEEISIEEERKFLSRAQVVDTDEVAAYAMCWGEFANGLLNKLFARATRDDNAGIVAKAVLEFLPRRYNKGLFLSKFDRRLLEACAATTFFRNSNAVSKVFLENDWLPDRFGRYRLTQWAASPIKALQSKHNEDWCRTFYCLTDSGRAILEHGVDDASSLPEIFVGGAKICATDGSWVVEVNGEKEAVVWWPAH